MKRVCYALLVTLLAGCGDKSLDVPLDYNPFDPDYTGANVVFLDSVIPKIYFYISTSGDTIIYNRSLKLYAHKNYECKYDCNCSFFQNGELMPASVLFTTDAVYSTITFSKSGTFSIDAAIGSEGCYSKHSDPVIITLK
jgi:hypothetical protein